MSVTLPDWVAGGLGVQVSHDDEVALADALAAPDVMLPSWFSVADLIGCLQASSYEKVEFVPSASLGKWRVVEVTVGSVPHCHILEVGKLEDSAIPTAASGTLLRIWLTEPCFDISAVREHGRGLIVAWLPGSGAQKLNTHLLVAAAGWHIPEKCAASPLTTTGAARLEISPSSLLVQEGQVYANIINAALGNSSPALRFLYLYRLFERAYLVGALEKLQGDFFGDPKKSLKVAENTVSSEKNSFLSLVEGSSAESAFGEIEAIFSSNTTSLGNRFMLAIERGARYDGDLGYKEAWKRGCVLAYKVRCSIVHSGKSAPIFESYDDAVNACEMLCRKMEEAALTFFGVSIID